LEYNPDFAVSRTAAVASDEGLNFKIHATQPFPAANSRNGETGRRGLSIEFEVQ
jgi:hypothetical protein